MNIFKSVVERTNIYLCTRTKKSNPFDFPLRQHSKEGSYKKKIPLAYRHGRSTFKRKSYYIRK